MKNDKGAVKLEMLMFAMRAGLFLLGLVGVINTGTLVFSKIREGDSAVYCFLVGGIGMCVAAFMMLGAVAGKWKNRV